MPFALRTPQPAIQMKVHRIRILESIDRLIQAKRFHSRGVEYSRKADPPGSVRPITAGFFGVRKASISVVLLQYRRAQRLQVLKMLRRVRRCETATHGHQTCNGDSK